MSQYFKSWAQPIFCSLGLPVLRGSGSPGFHGLGRGPIDFRWCNKKVSQRPLFYDSLGKFNYWLCNGLPNISTSAQNHDFVDGGARWGEGVAGWQKPAKRTNKLHDIKQGKIFMKCPPEPRKLSFCLGGAQFSCYQLSTGNRSKRY